MTKIVREGLEDITIRIRRVGRHVICTTDRPGIASSVERTIIETLSEENKPIGFHPS